MEQTPLVFAYESKPVSTEIAQQIADLRQAYSVLHKMLDDKVGGPHSGRYLSLAKTALEESCMWATKSLTHI